VEIINRKGLHARASAKLTRLAQEFRARVMVSRDSETADARSIMDLLMLGAGPGSRVLVEAEGEDAEAAVTAVVSLIRSRFGEQD
jgi:phosphocarrier protein